MPVSAGRRRVLIVVQNLPVPFDRRVWMEATSLARAGYEVSVICPKLKGYNASYEQVEGIDIHRYPMPFDPKSKLGFAGEYLYGLARTALLSIKVAFGRGFDVVHACNPPETYWVLGLFWKLFGKTYIFDHHDLSPELYEVKFPGSGGFMLHFLLFMERANFKVAKVVIAPNQSHKTIAVERGGVSPDHVFVVRSGPSPERFRVYEPDPSWTRGRKHLIAYLGEIGYQDGVDGMVRALAELRTRRDDFHAVFIGGGTFREEVMELADRLGLGEVTTFTGVVSDDDLCRILSSADLGIDPVPKNAWSDRSTMNKVIEYMHFGIPVVSFDLTEARVSAGPAGRYVTGGEREMAAEIDRLLDDEEQRRSMGEAAGRRFLEDLAWENSEPHLLAAYELAVGPPTPRGPE
jgi:glycosyltransferase involved in cell wall biosynthesis